MYDWIMPRIKLKNKNQSLDFATDDSLDSRFSNPILKSSVHQATPHTTLLVFPSNLCWVFLRFEVRKEERRKKNTNSSNRAINGISRMAFVLRFCRFDGTSRMEGRYKKIYRVSIPRSERKPNQTLITIKRTPVWL